MNESNFDFDVEKHINELMADARTMTQATYLKQFIGHYLPKFQQENYYTLLGTLIAGDGLRLGLTSLMWDIQGGEETAAAREAVDQLLHSTLGHRVTSLKYQCLVMEMLERHKAQLAQSGYRIKGADIQKSQAASLYVLTYFPHWSGFKVLEREIR